MKTCDRTPQFPYCARDKVVQIGNQIGQVTNIIEGGEKFELLSFVSGISIRYATSHVVEIWSPCEEVRERTWTWHQFEQFVIEQTKLTLDQTRWRVASQWGRKYLQKDGETIGLRMDVHIAERRQGGRGIVLDAKHFTKVPLNKNEINTTEHYRRSTRSSLGIVVVSPATCVPSSVVAYARELGRIVIVPADQSLPNTLIKLVETVSAGIW
jgi:hypothetical protein